MQANSCAHTQIRLQLSQELFANAGYHLNHYSALVTTDGWSIWLSMRPASQPVVDANRNTLLWVDLKEEVGLSRFVA